MPRQLCMKGHVSCVFIPIPPIWSIEIRDVPNPDTVVLGDSWRTTSLHFMLGTEKAGFTISCGNMLDSFASVTKVKQARSKDSFSHVLA